MLILSRKINEEIKINNDVTIKIISISENQVKIGIDAPKEMQIYRGEIYDKVRESAQIAVQKIKEIPADISKLKIKKLK